MTPSADDQLSREFWRGACRLVDEVVTLSPPLTDAFLHVHLVGDGFLLWEVRTGKQRECRPFPRFDYMRIEFNDLAQGTIRELTPAERVPANVDQVHRAMRSMVHLTVDSPTPWRARAGLFGKQSKLVSVMLVLRPNVAPPVWKLSVWFPPGAPHVQANTEEREITAENLGRFISPP